MAPGLKVRPLRPSEREAALARLRGAPRENLLLIDAVRRLGQSPAAGETRCEVLGAWLDGELAAAASLQPAIAVSAGASAELIEALLPHLSTPRSGLLKCEEGQAAALWKRLSAQGRVALLDRVELVYSLRPGDARAPELPPRARVRPARAADLEALVEAARESLREESRPDPFEGDAAGFRRWVASRVGRAMVLEASGAPRFVAYADVQAPCGWLLQGVYTWPHWRRHGFAAAGVHRLCQRAFAAGAGHVQLAVVEGNTAAERLYASLGFCCFGRVRTVLFH